MPCFCFVPHKSMVVKRAIIKSKLFYFEKLAFIFLTILVLSGYFLVILSFTDPIKSFSHIWV